MDLLRILSDLRIRARVTLLAAIAVLGVVALGGAYLYGDLKTQEAARERADFAALEVLVGEVDSGALQMRRREKDFLLRRDSVYQEKYHKEVMKVLAALEALAGLDMAREVKGHAEALHRGVEEHAARFDKVVALHERRGLNEKSGLEGELRKAVHAAETTLKEAGLESLTIKMLMMRRHEKDFLLRGAEKYIGRIDKRRVEFDALLAGAAVSPTLKRELTALMDAYQKGFHALAEVSLELGRETPKLSKIFADMQPSFEALFVAAEQGAAAAAEKLDQRRALTRAVMLIAVLVILAAVIALSLLIGLSIARPVAALTETMKVLADGDTEVTVPAVDQKDELGEMARAVEVFKTNALKRLTLEAEQSEARRKVESRAERIGTLTDTFDAKVAAALGQVGSAVGQLEQTSTTMTKTARQTSARSGAVATAAEQASANVQTVAAASEELSSSIDEIGRQVTQSTEIAGKAVEQTEETSQTMKSLAEAAEGIGAVVNLIQDIAEQTNLLALNATIEAARAGEAGKGFAVVASEVKSLANQTAKATEDISRQISGIQGSAGDAVGAIEAINGVIGQLSETAAAIAGAVEEQGVSTREIAQNVQQAARGTREVTENISEVSEGAGQTEDAAGQIGQLAGDLTRQAAELKAEIETFITEVQAA